jgi:hypothetical protein
LCENISFNLAFPVPTHPHTTLNNVRSNGYFVLRFLAEDASKRLNEILDTVLAALVSQDSGARSQESGVRSQESGVRSQESGVRSQESGVRSQESGVEAVARDDLKRNSET